MKNNFIRSQCNLRILPSIPTGRIVFTIGVAGIITLLWYSALVPAFFNNINNLDKLTLENDLSTIVAIISLPFVNLLYIMALYYILQKIAHPVKHGRRPEKKKASKRTKVIHTAFLLLIILNISLPLWRARNELIGKELTDNFDFKRGGLQWEIGKFAFKKSLYLTGNHAFREKLRKLNEYSNSRSQNDKYYVYPDKIELLKAENAELQRYSDLKLSYVDSSGFHYAIRKSKGYSILVLLMLSFFMETIILLLGWAFDYIYLRLLNIISLFSMPFLLFLKVHAVIYLYFLTRRSVDFWGFQAFILHNSVPYVFTAIILMILALVGCNVVVKTRKNIDLGVIRKHNLLERLLCKKHSGSSSGSSDFFFTVTFIATMNLMIFGIYYAYPTVLNNIWGIKYPMDYGTRIGQEALMTIPFGIMTSVLIAIILDSNQRRIIRFDYVMLKAKDIVMYVLIENPTRILVGFLITGIWLSIPIFTSDMFLFMQVKESVRKISILFITNALFSSVILWFSPFYENLVNLELAYTKAYRARLFRQLSAAREHLIVVGIGDMGQRFINGFLRNKVYRPTDLQYMILPDGKVVCLLIGVVVVDIDPRKMEYVVQAGNKKLGLFKTTVKVETTGDENELQSAYVLAVVGDIRSATVRMLVGFDRAINVISLTSDLNTSIDLFDILKESRYSNVVGTIGILSSINISYFSYRILSENINAFLVHPVYMRSQKTAQLLYSLIVKSTSECSTGRRYFGQKRRDSRVVNDKLPKKILFIGSGTQIFYIVDTLKKLLPDRTIGSFNYPIELNVMTNDADYSEEGRITVNPQLRRYVGKIEEGLIGKNLKIHRYKLLTTESLITCLEAVKPFIIVISDLDVQNQIRQIRSLNIAISMLKSSGRSLTEDLQILVDGETGVSHRARNIGDSVIHASSLIDFSNDTIKLRYPVQMGLASREDLVGDSIIDIMVEPSDRIESIVKILNDPYPEVQLNLCASDYPGSLAFILCKLSRLKMSKRSITSDYYPSFIMANTRSSGESHFCYQSLVSLRKGPVQTKISHVFQIEEKKVRPIRRIRRINRVRPIKRKKRINRIFKSLVVPTGRSYGSAHRVHDREIVIDKMNALLGLEEKNDYHSLFDIKNSKKAVKNSGENNGGELSVNTDYLQFIKDHCPGCNQCIIDSYHTHLFSFVELMKIGEIDNPGYSYQPEHRQKISLSRHQKYRLKNKAYKFHKGELFENRKKVNEPLAKITVCVKDGDLSGSFASTLAHLMGYPVTRMEPPGESDSMFDIKYFSDYQCHDDRYMSIIAFGNLFNQKKKLISQYEKQEKYDCYASVDSSNKLDEIQSTATRSKGKQGEFPSWTPIQFVFIRPANCFEQWEKYLNQLSDFFNVKLNLIRTHDNKDIVAFSMGSGHRDIPDECRSRSSKCPMVKDDIFSFAKDYSNDLKTCAQNSQMET